MAKYEEIEFIALRTIRYNDRNNILSAWSRRHGRLSFLLPAGNGREAMRRRALSMPLSLVSCTADLGRRRDIITMRDPAPLIPLHGIHSHPVKASIAMFVAEVLATTLRETQGDDAIYAFLVESILALNDLPSTRLLNYHITFLARLTTFLGIAPDHSTYRSGSYLDMTDGIYRPTPPVTARFLSQRDSALAATLGRIDYTSMHHLHFTRAERNTITDTILAYYTLHHAPMGHLTTLPILRSL